MADDKDKNAPILEVLEEDDEFEVSLMVEPLTTSWYKARGVGTNTISRTCQEFADPDWEVPPADAEEDQQWQVGWAGCLECSIVGRRAPKGGQALSLWKPLHEGT
jgi:hypothetical protein